jgi:hypothetical protein
MPGSNKATDDAQAISTHFPFRRTIVVVEALVGLGGLAGSMQLHRSGDSACVRA